MNSQKPYSTFYKVFYRIPVAVAKVFIRIKPWVLDSKKNTYWPEKPLKSHFRILADHLWYACKYGFNLDDYYPMGLDVKGKHVKDYVSDIVQMIAMQGLNGSFKIKYNNIKFDLLGCIRDKWIFAQMMKSYGFPIPKTYGLIKGGKLFKVDPYSENDLSVMANEELNVFLKPVDGICGVGIYHVRTGGGKIVYQGKEISSSELKEMVKDGKYLVQYFIINQHPGMVKLYDGAVNTLRIVVAHDPDGPHVIGRMCMMGAHGTSRSNWHFGGVAINLKEDGTLDKYGFCKIDKKVLSHPDSGTVFEGYKIPYFDEAIELAKNASSLFYGFASMGWDIAITENGPVIIEGNDDWGLVAHQMVEDRGYAPLWIEHFGKISL